MSPDITDAAYQISPADSLTRPCNGKLQRAPNDAQTPVSDAHRIRQKRAYVDVHFHSLLAELDERESREPGWAYRNESTVGLVPVQEPRLERKSVLLDGRGRVAETVARRKRYQGEPGSGGTYRHNPICDAHDAKTSSAIGPLPRAARVRDSDSPDDVDANVKEGHEKP